MRTHRRPTVNTRLSPIGTDFAGALQGFQPDSEAIDVRTDKNWRLLGQGLAILSLTAALAGCGGSSDGRSSGASGAAAPSASVAGMSPSVSGTPATAVAVDDRYSFRPTVANLAGMPLSFSIQNKPSWASFGRATGKLSGTPSATDAGTYAGIVIAASDGTTRIALPVFSIRVMAAAGNSSSNGAASATGSGSTYTVSVAVSGLSGAELVLQDNGGNNLAVSSSGTLKFSAALASGANYSVTVLAQPSGQTCSVVNGSGTVGASNITNIVVSCIGSTGASGSHVTAIWANDGEDKVTQDELRATTNSAAVRNSVWDGTTVKQFGARNEVVSFNLILEAGNSAATNVAVSLSNLSGPSGSIIRSVPRTTANLFNWTGTECELFFVRYLQITGLSYHGYGSYYEPQIPVKLEQPGSINPNGGPYTGTGGWTMRPNHDKFYPDIAVPLELVPTFTIATASNQSIWVDIYIPSMIAAGSYVGTVTVSENGTATHQIPVALTVRNFALPDTPSSKTMLFSSYADISLRYTGVAWSNSGTAQDEVTEQVLNNERLLAHRHKISLIGDDGTQSGDSPGSTYVPALTGALFTAANGYAGPGVSVGNNVYSIGTYGSWQSASWTATQASFWTNTNGWETWFEANSPSTTRFVYLIDESTNYSQTETWANWMATNPGIGQKLPSFATINLLNAEASVPSLNIAATTGIPGETSAFQATVNTYLADSPAKQLYMYSGFRPFEGSFETEDEGTALRELPWGQYKKGVNRWFYWEATYYDNTQEGGSGSADLFNNATTFGAPRTTSDPSLGMTGNASSNGEGVLFYPGTDALFPASSYGISGPIASLRLKHWRRGIQDVDYLTLAASIDPTAVANLVQQTVPSVLWELGCATSDCSWVIASPSWSADPSAWETTRLALAHIIDGQ
jgi:hypothetical protein